MEKTTIVVDFERTKNHCSDNEFSAKEVQRVLLTGEFRHSVDAKNRIFIPAKMREELGETFMVVLDLHERCLQIHSMQGWEEYIAPIKQLPRAEQAVVMRMLHSSAAVVTPDSQGRVLLPAQLIRESGIEKNAVILGCEAYAEIWPEAVYEEKFGSPDYASISEMLRGYGL